MLITKRGIVRGAAAALLLAAMGCDRADPRLKTLTAGISKDSAITLMEKAKPKKTDPFLFNGQFIEAMYFPKQGKTDSVSLLDRNMAPLVVINGKLAGWGWTYWDSVAAMNHITVAKKN